MPTKMVPVNPVRSTRPDDQINTTLRRASWCMTGAKAPLILAATRRSFVAREQITQRSARRIRRTPPENP